MRLTAVDLFAGAGGMSTGAVMAGCRVAWAANHWPAAVAVHEANHPNTAHSCQDLHQADWSAVPAHDLLLASPSCTGHTRARGKDRPHHDAARSTAWAVVSAAEACRPPVVLVENVPEFRSWALYPQWLSCMVALGYAAHEQVLDAADLGVPQHRRRLFITLSRSRAPLVLALPSRPRRAARDVVDFAVGAWSPVAGTPKRPRASSTLARVREGRRVHGDRFLISYYGSTRGGRSLDRPLGTITARERHAVVDGDRMRMLTVDECRTAMGFPAGYRLDVDRRTAVHLLGNAVCPPVAEALCSAVARAQ